VTITSVGYGDKIPATGLGRTIAVLLMMIGVGICGYMAAWLMRVMFIEEEQEEHDRLISVENKVIGLTNQVDEISHRLDGLHEILQRLEEKIDERAPNLDDSS